MIVIELLLDLLGSKARNKVAVGVGTIVLMSIAALLWIGLTSEGSTL